jgi:hypothetical protein
MSSRSWQCYNELSVQADSHGGDSIGIVSYLMPYAIAAYLLAVSLNKTGDGIFLAI